MLILFGVCSTPVLLQWHVKDPGDSATSAGGRLEPKHSYTLDPRKSEWADYATVGTYPETSSRATCQGTLGHSRFSSQPLWTDSGLKNGISVRELISTSKKEKEKSAGRK